MLIYVILIIVFLTIFLIAFMIMWSIRRKIDPGTKRLKNLKETTQNPLLEQYKAISEIGLKSSKLNPRIEKFLLEVSKFARQDERKNTKQRRSLLYAGYYQENSYKLFVSSKIICAAFLSLFFLYIGIIGQKSAPLILLLSIVMGLCGYIIPNLILNSKIQRRQVEIAKGLPDALDLLVITVECRDFASRAGIAKAI